MPPFIVSSELVNFSQQNQLNKDEVTAWFSMRTTPAAAAAAAAASGTFILARCLSLISLVKPRGPATPWQVSSESREHKRLAADTKRPRVLETLTAAAA